MPNYLITDSVTGKKFKVTGDSPPTEQEAAKIFADFGGQSSEWVQKAGTEGKSVKDMERQFILDEGRTKTQKVLGAAMPYVRPVLEGAGATLGGIAGTAGGAAAGLGIGSIPGAAVGGVAGAGLGYASGAKLSDMLETMAGNNTRPQAPTVAGQLAQSAGDIATGATFEMGGQAAVPALSAMAKGVGMVAKPVLGKLSGTGTGAIDEAIKSGRQATNSMNPLKSITAYDDALRGNTSGDDIVDTAKTALGRIKDSRARKYQSDLAAIGQNTSNIDTRPIKQELSDLMNSYGVKIDPASGAIDTTRIAMGKSGRNDIEEIIGNVSQWGTKQGDNTALGLDTLKRQLDDFYSDSSQARQFVTALRDKVKSTITTAVPQYDEMTKGYADATKVIKDIESGLMLRKQGMTGRVVADQTLRRLMSSMKDNFALRKELVDVLGKEGGEDLAGAIAGYTQRSVVPLGMQGNLASTAAAGTVAKLLDPAWASLIVASSPRVQGEFFRMLGKGMKTIEATGAARPATIRQIAIQSQGENK